MRKQRIILKNGIRLALIGRQQTDVFIVEQNRALIGEFESRNNPQQGGFSAARRPQKRKKFPLIDFQTHIVQRAKSTEMLRYAVN